MIFWLGTFSVKSTCTLNFRVNIGPQRGLNTQKTTPANTKIEKSKGASGFCAFFLSCWRNELQAVDLIALSAAGPQPCSLCSMASSCAAGWEASPTAACLCSLGLGLQGQARGPFKAPDFTAWRNSLVSFNFIPAVKSIPNNDI